MKSEQEYIEEMAYSICNKFYIGEPKNCTECTHKTDCHNINFAKAFYNVNYRKTSDVIEEFVERLKAKESPKLLTWEYGEGYSDCIKIVEQIAAEMRQEVEK